ncbi:MAG: 50S ribosomal protein L24 [Pseudomonadota bacterium]
MVKQKLRKGDTVIVLTGRDKGKKGEILKMFPGENRAIVAGVNIVTKHQKATRTEAGGIVKKEAKIQVSNIAYLDNDGRPTKVGFKILEAGKKVRFAKKSGEIIETKK